MTYEQETLWLAGLLEGEACFHGTRDGHGKPSNGACIQLLMTDEDVVNKAAAICNAKVYPRKPDTRGKWKPAWRMCVSGNRAVEVMKRILPFMGQRRKCKIEELLLIASHRLSLTERMKRASSARHKHKDELTIQLFEESKT